MLYFFSCVFPISGRRSFSHGSIYCLESDVDENLAYQGGGEPVSTGEDFDEETLIVLVSAINPRSVLPFMRDIPSAQHKGS